MVADLGADLLQPEDAAAVYHAAAPGEIYPIHLAVRTGGDPAAFTPRLRHLVADVLRRLLRAACSGALRIAPNRAIREVG